MENVIRHSLRITQANKSIFADGTRQFNDPLAVKRQTSTLDIAGAQDSLNVWGSRIHVINAIRLLAPDPRNTTLPVGINESRVSQFRNRQLDQAARVFQKR